MNLRSTVDAKLEMLMEMIQQLFLSDENDRFRWDLEKEKYIYTAKSMYI
jgi:hypothetical protein